MLSKNAMNNMKNRYVAVLTKCRLMNAFGSLAVASTLAVSAMTGLAMTGLAMPSDALADEPSASLYVGGEVASLTYDETTGFYTWASSGDITVNGNETGEAFSVYAYSDDSSISLTLSSDHSITVTYELQNSIGAYGMAAEGTTNELNNNGTIDVTATTGTDGTAEAYGMYAEGTTNELNNGVDGTINVSAESTSGDAYAYGMYTDGDATLNNFGTITVSASSTDGTAYAYQAYVWAGTANIGTWTLELKEDYGTNYVFGVSGFGTLNFGVDGAGATFIITNDSADGTIYAVADMVNAESDGTIDGYIAEVNSKYDFVEWSIVNEDGSAYDFSEADWEDQYISGELTLNEDNSPTQAAATQTVSTVTGHMTNLGKIIAVQTPSATVASSASPASVVPSSGPSSVPSGPNSGPNGGPNGGSHEESLATSTMYADAGGSFSDAGTAYMDPQAPLWTAFLMPFYSYSSENGGDYSTNMMGLALGASRAVGDDMTLGFHASLSRALSDSDYTDSTATSYALGVHGLYNIDGALYVRGQVSGFYSESDMDIASSTGADASKANADMDTYGFYAQVAAGYDMVLTPQHRVTPEIALSYMYAHMEGFDSAYYDSTGVKGESFSMNSEDFDAVYADASVRWTGSYDLGSDQKGKDMGTLKPTAKVGIRQALTDPEVSSTMEVLGKSTTTYSDLNETAFTCEAGLAWDMGDVDVSLTYTGEFGDVEFTHMGMFKVEWKF